jgi:hypothetical protein
LFCHKEDCPVPCFYKLYLLQNKNHSKLQNSARILAEILHVELCSFHLHWLGFPYWGPYMCSGLALTLPGFWNWCPTRYSFWVQLLRVNDQHRKTTINSIKQEFLWNLDPQHRIEDSLFSSSASNFPGPYPRIRWKLSKRKLAPNVRHISISEWQRESQS